MSDLATLTIQGSIATLTLNRPDARNALSLELLAALHARVDELGAPSLREGNPALGTPSLREGNPALGTPSLREGNPALQHRAMNSPLGERGYPSPTVLILTGAGKSFCAGMDLKLVLDQPGAPARLLHSLAELTLKLRALPLVSLAMVNGAAIGGGCGLACVTDLAITHADSKMGYPEVDLGVCPAVVAPWLVRKVGAGRARMILLTGGTMSGQRAHELGMVDRIVPTLADLDAATQELAQRLATGGPHALRATKDLLNQLDGSLDAAVLRRGADLSAKVVALPETQALLRAKLGT